MERRINAALVSFVLFVGAGCSGSDPAGPGGVRDPDPLTHRAEAIHATPVLLSLSGSADGTLIGAGLDGAVPMRRSGAWSLQALEFPVSAGGFVDLQASSTGGAFVLDADHAWVSAQEAIYVYESGVWSTTHLPGTNAGGVAIVARAPDDVWTAGLRTLHHYDGVAWSAVTLPEGTVVRGLRTAPDGTLFVAGDDGILLRDTGNGLVPIDTGTSTRLRDVFAVHGSRAIIVGDDGLCLSLVGSEVTVVPTGVSGRLTVVHGTSIGAVYAAGNGGVFLRFDGQNWSPLPGLGDVQVTGLFVARGDEIYAGTVERGVLRFDGEGWATEYGDDDRVFYRDVFALPNGDAWMVAQGTSNGVITHVDAAGRVLHHRIPQVTTINTVWASAPDDVWAAGQQAGVQHLLHFDGAQWRVLPSPMTAAAQDMWGSGPEDVFVVGRDGATAHFDGASWRALDSGTTQHLFAVMGTGPDRVLAGGQNGILLEYDGAKWVDVPSPTSTGLSDLWIDDRGLLLVSFSELFVQTATGYDVFPRLGDVQSIWRSPSATVFGCGSRGNLVRLGEGGWEPLVRARTSAQTLEAIHGFDDRRFFAAGGMVLLEINGQ